MNTNSGTATRVSLLMIPNSRLGMVPRNDTSNTPARAPPRANSNAVPPSVKATGKPASSRSTTQANIAKAGQYIV